MTVAHWDDVEHEPRGDEINALWPREGYPRSKEIFLRRIRVIGRIEELDYFDGEPLEDD